MSSGVRWSDGVKQGFLRHHPSLTLVDTLGSSESPGAGRSVTGREGRSNTGGFVLSPRTRVLTEDGRDVLAGSNDVGLIVHFGRGPIGYYKDPEKSAQTFPMIEGQRATILGDYATVEHDGTISLLGRGSACINTAGEKVFPEEVEDALRSHTDVEDVAVVGLADDIYGEKVCALVVMRPGFVVDPATLIAHVKSRVAGYKAPKQLYAVDSLGRGPNGKLDYRWLKELAVRLASCGP